MTDIVTVYSLPSCVQCDQTKTLMRRLGIKFRDVDLSVNDKLRGEIRDTYGFSTAPVVVTPEDAWGGFDPAKIRGLV